MCGINEVPQGGSSKYPKMLATRQGLFRGALSFIQHWLNNETPPDRGVRWSNNKVIYEGIDSFTLEGENGTITYSPYGQGIFRVCYCAGGKKEPRLEGNSWTIDLTKQSPDGWKVNLTADTAEYTCSLPGGIEAGITIVDTDGTVTCRIASEKVMLDHHPVETTKEWLLVEKSLPRPGTVGVFGLGETPPPNE